MGYRGKYKRGEGEEGSLSEREGRYEISEQVAKIAVKPGAVGEPDRFGEDQYFCQ